MNTGLIKKYGDKLLFALALAVLATGISFHGLKAIIAGSQKAPPAIVFAHWWENDSVNEALWELKKEFEDLHGRMVIFENKPYEDIRKELFNPGAESAWAGKKPDVFALDPLWIPELLETGIIEDRLNGAPLLLDINVLYYNVGILREAGFSRPPKSRSEFLDYARVLTRAKGDFDGVLCFGWSKGKSTRGIYDDIFPWIWSAGAELIKDGKPALTSRPVVESLSFLAALYREGFIAPDTGAGNKPEDFISGRAAFMIAPASELRFIRERMGDEAFDVTSVPIPDNYAGRSFYASAGWTLGLNPASSHREETRLFAEFFAEKALFLSEKTGVVPGTGVLRNSGDMGPFHSKLWDIATAAEPAQDFSGLPWMKLEEIFREELRALFDERSSSAETAAAIQKKWEAVLSAPPL
jgi:ABC-type glycerol-3-phosphate transport system substrate-binding protein